MAEKQAHYTLHGKKPLNQLIVSLVIIIVLGTVLMMVAAMGGVMIFGSDLDLDSLKSSVPGQSDIALLRFLLFAQEFAFFIIPALVIMTLMKPDYNHKMEGFMIPESKDLILVVMLAFAIFPITGITGELNSSMSLPQWLSGLEEWIIEKEDNANEVIGMLIASREISVLILNLIIIGILPALGEELIFRGVVQKILQSLFKSGNMAVWVTAFLFSAVHLQFFGFIPRFILGLVFGYLYYWGGTLWLPVLAHFLNNAVSVAGAYLYGWEAESLPSDPGILKELLYLPVPLIIMAAILVYFRNKWIARKDDENLIRRDN